MRLRGLFFCWFEKVQVEHFQKWKALLLWNTRSISNWIMGSSIGFRFHSRCHSPVRLVSITFIQIQMSVCRCFYIASVLLSTQRLHNKTETKSLLYAIFVYLHRIVSRQWQVWHSSYTLVRCFTFTVSRVRSASNSLTSHCLHNLSAFTVVTLLIQLAANCCLLLLNSHKFDITALSYRFALPAHSVYTNISFGTVTTSDFVSDATALIPITLLWLLNRQQGTTGVQQSCIGLHE